MVYERATEVPEEGHSFLAYDVSVTGLCSYVCFYPG